MKNITRFPSARQSALAVVTGILPAVCLALLSQAEARPNIKDAFLSVYPNAVGSRLDNLPSMTNHCAVCHYQAAGAGLKNPYGVALVNSGFALNKTQGRINAVKAVANLDSDADGYPSAIEIEGAGFANIPTFPGLSSANVGLVTGVPQIEISPYLTPVTTVDNTPPQVALLTPNGGGSVTANAATTVTWTASDASGINAVNIDLSLDGGTSYTPVVQGIENTGSYTWFPANRPTAEARIRVTAFDGAGNSAFDASDADFAIVSPEGGRVPTTLRDFDMPGSQPFEGGPEPAAPSSCAECHGNYNAAVEPYRNWQGSMMALASRDPLFEANLVIANQDAPDSGDLCLRCHNSGGWLQGRSVPTDGSAMQPQDKVGVSCDLCHRMVDPVFTTGNPARDQQVLDDLTDPGTQYGNGMYVLDPSAIQRGPYDDVVSPHQFVVSPFHRKSEFCGTCHDVSNPAFTKDANGVYQPNPFNTTGGDISAHSAGPVERTYSEWKHSAYNTTPGGIYQPQFAGNKPDGKVSTCQDCHMRDVSGKGASTANAPVREDLPLHDMTGGSTWLPPLIAQMYPAEVNAAAVQAGVARATEMLQHAADLAVSIQSGKLSVRVTNQTGHKLPTGYPEGRRIWVNVKFFNAAGAVLTESAAYDASTGVLSHDPEAKIYEVHPGIDDNISEVVGLPAGPSLHFVLNNKIYTDNRIPPRGFKNAEFAEFGGAPVGYSYADGQHWDDTAYGIPAGARRAEVRLFYQSTSKEFIEFLRDENRTNTKGQEMYDLWDQNGKCPPTLMAQSEWVAPELVFAGLASAAPGVESAALAWSAATGGTPPVTYHVYQATVAGAQDFGAPVLSTTDLGVTISPLHPGTTAPQTYWLVVRATDSAGGSEANTVELPVTPLLDPEKDQDGDGMANGVELLYGLNPFDPTDALEDTDGDGLQNLAETAFGSDPTDAGSCHSPQAEWVGTGDETTFAVRYIRRQNDPAATIVVEVSTALGGWNSGPEFTTVHSVADNHDGTETVIERMNARVSATDRAFIRLRVAPK